MPIPFPILRTLRLAVLALVPTTAAWATPRMDDLQSVLRTDPRNVAACTALARAYLQEMRETGDASFEAKADSLVSRALAVDSTDATALLVRGTIDLGRHDFASALATAERARTLAPRAVDALALLADAQIELGREADAAATLQRFVDAHPCLAAFARISYFRELHGDRAGAIAAMTQALSSGGSTPADAAWCAAHAGLLHVGAGSLDEASRLFERALALSPRCVPAMAGCAHIAAARGDTTRAIALYESANATQPLVENIVALGDLHAYLGHTRDAVRQYHLAAVLLAAAHERGVDTALDGAAFEADRAQGDSVTLARLADRTRAARARRPSPTADHVLAWVLYRAGDVTGARSAMDSALRWGTDDPRILYHAGVIAAAAADLRASRSFLTRALAPVGALSLRDAALARQALVRLPPMSQGMLR